MPHLRFAPGSMRYVLPASAAVALPLLEDRTMTREDTTDRLNPGPQGSTDHGDGLHPLGSGAGFPQWQGALR